MSEVKSEPTIKIEFTAKKLEMLLGCMNMARVQLMREGKDVRPLLREAQRIMAAERVLNRTEDPNFRENSSKNFKIPPFRPTPNYPG